MKVVKASLIVTGALTCVGTIWATVERLHMLQLANHTLSVERDTLLAAQEKDKQLNEEDTQLEQLIYRIMDDRNIDSSGISRTMTAKILIRASRKYLTNFSDRQFFIALIANESRFNKSAQSSAGAIGIAQILKPYAMEFAKQCQVDGFRIDDLVDPEINAMLGACVLSRLLANMNNNMALALTAYNAGPNSKSVKQLASLRNIENTETASYAAKVLMIKEDAKIEKVSKNVLKKDKIIAPTLSK